MDAATRRKIETSYPAFAWLLDVPEVGDLLGRAAVEGWDITRLQAQLYATSWWKRTSQTQRNWSTLIATDPAEARRQRAQRQSEVDAEVARLGVRLTANEKRFLVEVSLGQGFDQAQITRNILKIGKTRLASSGGEVRRNLQQIDALAKNMAFPVSHTTAGRWAYDIAAGAQTLDGLQAHMTEWAKDKYAKNTQVVRGLERGLTMWDIVQPTLGRVAEELGMSIDAFDLTKGRGAKLINYQDPKTGELRLMNDTEATGFARSQREWRDTNNGKSLASQLVEGMTKKFGRR